MRVVDLIRRKRDSGELSPEEIQFLVDGYTRDAIPDYQMAAWLMAVLLRGMSRAETAALTESMLHSGQTLDFSDLPAKKVDKHSTGGIGDKTSLIIAPAVAAGGLLVPMISGRGLGHSGGTLDKLESIPGFNVNLSLADFRRVLEQCGCALIGQTAEIAPADKKIYALRDVTGTVESPALICGSIMSKKLAEGIDALVLDVKTGSGAFMKKLEDAAALAELRSASGVLAEAIDRDAGAYEAVMTAFRLPKGTLEEQHARTAAIQQATKGAAEVPLQVAAAAAALYELLGQLEGYSSASMISDLRVGRLMAAAAARGALENVTINLASITDAEYVAAMREKAVAIEARLAGSPVIAA